MAAGTYSAEHVDQLLRCPVCLDRYTSPKILPCQHTVCKSPCLEGLIDRFARTVKCPECRAEHFLPRNGVDSFPTNITISGFLDLQSTASGEDARSSRDRGADEAGAAGSNPRKCAVCENEADTIKCFHCDKMVCPSCKQSHTGQMKMDVVRLINQIRRGLPKLSNRMSQVEQKGECMKQAIEAIKAQVRGTFERYMNELKEREVLVCSELETFQQGELRSLRLHTENIEVELASISSYCDSMESFLNTAEATVPEADLVNIKHQCSEYMQQLRRAEGEEMPHTRTARFHFSGEPLHLSIADFGAVSVVDSGGGAAGGGGGGSTARSGGRRTSEGRREPSPPEPPRARARWSTPNAARLALAEDPAQSPRPPAYRPPVPPYQVDPMLSSRSPRNDMSWIQPSTSAPPGEPDRSIYLPSRHEDYMFAMSTNTENIREVLEEIRRQEEWEMNATIRESARSRNTRQNVDLFGGTPRGGRGGQRGPRERMAGLMGGGGGGAGGGGATSPDRFRDSSPAFGSGREIGVGGLRRTRHRQPTPVVADVDTLMALEDEIHGMDTSQNGTVSSAPPAANQNSSRTNQNSNRAGATNRVESRNSSQNAAPSLQPLPNQAANQSVASSSERPLMGGAAAPNVGGASNGSVRQSGTGASQRGARNGPNARGRGRGVGRGTRQPPGNNRPATQRPGNNQQNAQPDAAASNSNSNNNGLAPVSHNSSPRRATNTTANSTGLRRGRALTNVSENPPAPATRSRTFVQQEPTTTSENADLPTVSNNGLSFSINFDDAAPAPNASGHRRPGINTNNAATSGPRPSDSLSANRALNNYKRKGQVFKILGSGKGSNEGQLKWPRGLALSPINDSFLTADSSNHRVQMFDVNGEFAMKFGSYGAQEGEFDCLTGIAVNGLGEIVICDRYNNRIQVFDRYGQFVRAFGSEGSGEGQLSYPWGVVCDTAGLIYVCDKENHRIQVFRPDGTFVRKFGHLGKRPGQLENPHYIAITPENKILVSDTSNHRIQMFSTNGVYIKSFGIKGNGHGQLKCPKGIAVDAQGFIVVADSGNGRVQVFRGNGDYFYHFGSAGTGSGQFRGMEGLAVTNDGKVVVCDSDNHRIQVF